MSFPTRLDKRKGSFSAGVAVNKPLGVRFIRAATLAQGRNRPDSPP